MWIDDGEKYALVGLQVNLEGEPPPERIAPNLRVLTDTTFDVPPEWREWLGSIRADQVEGSNLFLVSKLESTTPAVLDGENQSLQQRVRHFYAGLLLSAMFSPSHEPVMLTGARQEGVLGIRQQTDLDIPAPQIFRPYPPVVASDIRLAAQLAQQLDAMQPDAAPAHLLRLLRTLHIYVRTRAIREPLDRIHQYCRCIDGLILPAIGKTKRQFKSRTQLFIGPTRHDLMGELYDIRSNVEHLHENQYLETFEREVRLDLVAKEAIVEYIARSALARIIGDDALWAHFGNTVALEAFWSLSPDERSNIWGDPIDPLEPLADFDPEYLHDGRLGKT
ncbi:MAG: hypothetical protein OXC28_02335 [Defluviicoccus sp.]|nr:hypothetical protein [Defluviicoccus sp.]